MPMTAADMVAYHSGAAVVAYLGQPDASPAVCDLRARGPHVAAFTEDVRGALVGGLVDGKVAPAVWSRCVQVAFEWMPIDDASSLVDASLNAYVKLLDSGSLRSNPAVAERAATLQRLYLDRRAGLEGHPAVVTSVLAKLRELLAKKDLSPIARSFALEVVATADIAHGTWQGKTVDVAMMDALAAAGNEMTLSRFAQRLPQAELRREAGRRIVRIHIALSPFAEVRDHAEAVEDAVMRTGHNRVMLTDHALVRAWFDATATVRGVLVRQNVWQQSATLLGFDAGRSTLSVLPELSFRGSLWAEVNGVSRPITLCPDRRAFDPTPCIDVADVSLGNAFAYLDESGTFHLRDNVAEKELVAWASRDSFALPISLAGKAAVSLQWGLVFERPEPLEFVGRSAGARGPDVNVRVDHPNANRYVFEANGFIAIVQQADLAAYHVGSIGGRGASGVSGRAGTNGSSGSQCSDGGQGGDGTDGGNGGNGGDGGNVRATIACAAGNCDVELLRQVMFSVGGDGGAGGSGGAGGFGGSGGSSKSQQTHTDSNGNTVVDDPGCAAGSTGPQGQRGRDGAPGAPGRPGHVSVDFAR
jgi:hypothetical protein